MKIGNDIGDEGAKMIIEGLKSNSTLIELNLICDYKARSNEYNATYLQQWVTTDNGISKEGRKILKEAIKSNSLAHEMKLISMEQRNEDWYWW